MYVIIRLKYTIMVTLTFDLLNSKQNVVPVIFHIFDHQLKLFRNNNI